VDFAMVGTDHRNSLAHETPGYGDERASVMTGATV
jgi:hypothetical protein